MNFRSTDKMFVKNFFNLFSVNPADPRQYKTGFLRQGNHINFFKNGSDCFYICIEIRLRV